MAARSNDKIDTFCTDNCIEWIQRNSYKKVGLEFTDYKECAPLVSCKIKRGIRISPFILDDRSRSCGDCCIDERSSLPRGIQGIIHFGRTCLTPTKSMPVLYIFPYISSLSINKISSNLLKEEIPISENLILVYDTWYGSLIGDLYVELKKRFPNIVLSTIIVPENANIIYPNENICHKSTEELSNCLQSLNIQENSKTVKFNVRQVSIPVNKNMEDYNFIYIGEEATSLHTLQMRYSERTFYAIDRNGDNFSSSNALKAVMNRSKKIEKIKDAKIMGILGTLIKGHEEIISRIKKLIRSADKKCYTFFLGQITEAKLGNVDSVDVFVYIGCPQSSLFNRNHSSYIYQKIVAPWEVEVALNPNYEWSLQFETNFQEFLKLEHGLLQEEDGPSGAVQSLPCDTIAFRPEGTLSALHENGAGQALQSLSWQGLDPSQKSSVPTGVVVQGKTGIAKEYVSEIQHQ